MQNYNIVNINIHVMAPPTLYEPSLLPLRGTSLSWNDE